MQIYNYPVVCWRFNDDAIFGKIIGFDQEFVAENIRALKQSVKDWLAREFGDGWGYSPDIENAKLRCSTYKVYPSYESEKGVFPILEPTKVKVAAIYGENPEQGYALCYLPFLGRSFYFYDEKQLKTLIEHFVREQLEGKKPATIHQLTMETEPWLESVKVRIHNKPEQEQSVFSEDVLNYIKTYSEQLPQQRSLRRKLNVFPETAWERSTLIDSISNKLVNTDGHILVVGDAGTGKTVILMDAIRKSSRISKSGKKLDAPTFWHTQSQRLVANAKYLGEWQAQCENLIDALESVNGVLWISDLVELIRVGGEGIEDSVAAFIYPSIVKRRIRLIGELNPNEYIALQQAYPAFIAQFKLVEIPELTEVALGRIANKLCQYASENMKLTISKAATILSQRLLGRFQQYEKFPGKLVRFLTDCVRYSEQQKADRIDEDAIYKSFARQSGLPEIMIRDDMTLSNKMVVDYFNKHILHQKVAIQTLAQTVIVFKTGLNDPGKPISTLLFTGPTGVGKTAAAKTLASYFFGAGQKQDPLFRLDMSEFQHPMQISRLIGTESGQPGKLVEHVRERPFSVILLDEIEKANPAIFDVLLGVFDEGILLDRFGRLTDFRNCIIIMTSNIGTRNSNSIGFVDASLEHDISEIKNYFRPEFINRIDKIVSFNALDQDAVEDIARLELKNLDKREGIKKHHLRLTFTDDLVKQIAVEGFHPKYGARPLQRAIEQHVVTAISTWIINNKDTRKKDLELDYISDKINIKIKK